MYVGLHYTVAAFFGTVLGVLFNFKTTGTFVFKNRENRLIFRYVTVYAVLYLVNIGILKVLNMTGMNMYLAGALPIPLLAVLAYFMQKNFVFKASRGKCSA